MFFRSSDAIQAKHQHTLLIRSAGEISGACNAHNKIAPELISGLCGRPTNSNVNAINKILPTFTVQCYFIKLQSTRFLTNVFM